jgi:hypothetical protein
LDDDIFFLFNFTLLLFDKIIMESSWSIDWLSTIGIQVKAEARQESHDGLVKE